MTGLHAALADAARLRATTVGEHGYALAYGSHAHRCTHTDSDLDLLFVGTPLSDARVDRLTHAVVALHRHHGLRLDTEVAYEMKLHASLAEVDAAVALRGFTVDATGNLRVAAVVVARWFLNSPAFKLRLVLNALTTPHVFLGGNVDLYRRHCADADRAVALVALSLLDPAERFAVADAVAALVAGPSNAVGEDHLGYDHSPALHSTVHRGLAQLTAGQVAHPVDGVCFTQDHDRRRHLVANLHAPASLPIGGAGTQAGTIAPGARRTPA